MKQSNRRTPIVFYVALVLLCCVLFSTHLTSGLYARYTATATGGDSARVAKFNVTNQFTDSAPVGVNLSFFDPNAVSDQVEIQVTSASEVAIRYSVTVTMPELSDGTYENWLIVTLDGNAPTSVGTNTFTFSALRTIAHGDSTQYSHTLVFAIDANFYGKPGIEENITTDTVQITVHAEQVD